MAAEHLLARGFERFACVCNPRDRTDRITRDAYVKRIRSAGFTATTHDSPTRIQRTAGTWRAWTENVRSWLAEWTTPIAVFTGTDSLARYLADTCAQAGYSVPHDVAIVGTGNETSLCLHPEPSLTSIDFGYERIGYRAAELISRLMRSNSTKPQVWLEEPTGLMARQSTDSLAISDPMMAQALRYIAENSHHNIKVTNVAEAVGTTRRTLERRFRATLDRTVADEITRMRIMRLKRRLLETNTPIKALARASGFNSGRVMYLTFLRVVGMPPSEYRKLHRLHG
jgi:LacI family transcriptional regulator